MKNYSNAYIINSNYKKRKRKELIWTKLGILNPKTTYDNVVLSKNQCPDLNKLMSNSN